MALTNRAMSKVSLRNVVSHKLRLALTVLAVVLGTAFISGAFMFTKTLSNTFDTAVATSYDGVDVVLSPAEEGQAISYEGLAALRADPKVAQANVAATTRVALGDADGDAIQTGGASTIKPWYPEHEMVGQAEPIVDGRAPETVDEVVINKEAQEEFGIAVGDSLIAVDRAFRAGLVVTGIVDPDSDDPAAGTMSLGMSEAGYLERYAEDGAAPHLALAAASGTSTDELLDYLSDAYPQYRAEAGEELAKSLSDTVNEALKFVNYFLVAFGLIGLLVGTFLIANTFSMIVAQRIKEFALLRALGASRRQITASVIFEAVIVGVLGSLVGLVAGAGLVAGIKAVLASTGNELPGSGLGLSWQAVVIPIVLGTVVTVLSAWAPAQRAGRVRPVEAMRSTETSTASSLTARTIVGAVIILVGIACAVVAVINDSAGLNFRAGLVGAGLVLVIVGFFLAGPALSIPIVPSLGRIIGLPFGAIGKLAATNSRRNPRRVATTAFALTLGIALVTAIGMLGQTMKASLADQVDKQINADFLLTGPPGGQLPLPADTPELVRNVPGVASLSETSMAPLVVDGHTQFGMPIVQVVAGDLAHTMPLELDDATDVSTADPDGSTGDAMQSAEDLSVTEGFYANEDVAQEHNWSVGERYPVASPDGHAVEAPLLGIFPRDNQLGMPLVVAKATALKILEPAQLDLMQVAVVKDDAADASALRHDLEEAVKGLLVVQVMDSADLTDQLGDAVDAMLNILYGMLGLAVIIAVLGIVNTLTLNVIERRQEIGMLRAVGTQRGQVRTMIILEAVAIAIFGAGFGVVIGLGMGWAFLSVLAGAGLDTIAVPGALIGWMLLGSAVLGVLAALWPAARAARTAPLDAIAEE